MEQHEYTVVPYSLARLPSRREVLGGLAGAGLMLGPARLHIAAKAKKRKPKHKKGLCQKHGSPCNKPGKTCKQRYCLRAPFTIETVRQGDAGLQNYLFVPPQDGTTGPSPWIALVCNQTNSACETAYPFACADLGIKASGDAITTIHRLLPGRYEYWVWFEEEVAAGELTVALTDRDGRVVRDWTNPANATLDVGWHVFDVDGRTGRVTSIDVLPVAFPDPSTNVCPQ